MIKLEQARQLLLAAVNTQGRDFVYNPGRTASCLYSPATDFDVNQFDRPPHPNHPSRLTACLIGVALDLAGETRHHGSSQKIGYVAHEYPDMMTQGAAYYFGQAQAVQDSGGTWGEAYDAAERMYGQYLKVSFEESEGVSVDAAL